MIQFPPLTKWFAERYMRTAEHFLPEQLYWDLCILHRSAVSAAQRAEKEHGRHYSNLVV